MNFVYFSFPTPAMELVCLADYEKKSSQVVDANNWGYYSPGACESTTVNWNTESYKKYRGY